MGLLTVHAAVLDEEAGGAVLQLDGGAPLATAPFPAVGAHTVVVDCDE